MALNYDGWEKIFSELNIISQVNEVGYFDITATQIKTISNREPRLMTKIDFIEQLPPIMHKEGLALFAITNGTYRIGRFDPFIPIETKLQVTPEKITFPNNILTLNSQDLAHESAMLDAALISGILNQVFGEEVKLTIRGRARKSSFSFSINNVQFPISGVQIEVDGGYEGATSINLVEAKVGARSNINIRQIIYPQLAWENIVNRQKAVKSFICFYQEPILRFIPIIFENGFPRPDHQHELAFAFESEAKLDLMSIPVQPDAPFPVLGVPFPQADRFDSILAMLSIISKEREITKDDLAYYFDIVPRQIDYYSNTLRWLGLVEIKNATIKLTDEGQSISVMSHAKRMYRLADIIFSEPIFNHALHHQGKEIPSQLFKRWKIDLSTMYRRQQTVNAWIRYFESYIKKTR